MLLSTLMLDWSDLAGFHSLIGIAASASLSAFAGVSAARQMQVAELAWVAALIGAGTVVFTHTPSMFLCGSIGGGLYVLPAVLLHIESVYVGQTVVVASTAVGCAFFAWVLCLGLLSVPAVLIAFRRRGRSL